MPHLCSPFQPGCLSPPAPARDRARPGVLPPGNHERPVYGRRMRKSSRHSAEQPQRGLELLQPVPNRGLLALPHAPRDRGGAQPQAAAACKAPHLPITGGRVVTAVPPVRGPPWGQESGSQRHRVHCTRIHPLQRGSRPDQQHPRSRTHPPSARSD